MNLDWVRCGEHWCRFETVDLSNVNTIGIYLIWYRGNPGRVVRVGQGNIVERLMEHRQNPEILSYRDQGLLVTWATAAPESLNGVERYLANRYPPLTGEKFPVAPEIEVNSPWA